MSPATRAATCSRPASSWGVAERAVTAVVSVFAARANWYVSSVYSSLTTTARMHQLSTVACISFGKHSFRSEIALKSSMKALRKAGSCARSGRYMAEFKAPTNIMAESPSRWFSTIFLRMPDALLNFLSFRKITCSFARPSFNLVAGDFTGVISFFSSLGFFTLISAPKPKQSSSSSSAGTAGGVSAAATVGTLGSPPSRAFLGGGRPLKTSVTGLASFGFAGGMSL
mmetsp:Transcript_28961/g.67067  ORF Transcript_28961/g.67067 Transcript_28961/m.67067 type:complete len:227 (-) Transcript_28961:36-716(-)